MSDSLLTMHSHDKLHVHDDWLSCKQRTGHFLRCLSQEGLQTLDATQARDTPAALLKASKGGSSMKNQRKGRANQTTMTVTSTQSDALRSHVQQGAIYRDRSKNLIRLLSICGSYCVYVFLPDLRCSTHGSVAGLTRKDVFEAEFVFVARSVGDWVENQRRHSNESAPTMAGRAV